MKQNKKRREITSMPSVELLEKEVNRKKYQKRYFQVLRNTIYTLITVAAAAVLIAVLLLPVLQIYGSSMTPTLREGQIVVSLKGSEFRQGDVIAFYYNNKILVKRLIAGPGSWVNIDEDGNVYLNFQPGIALKASRAGNLHVIGTLNLCFSHTHIMFFRKFKSCL